MLTSVCSMGGQVVRRRTLGFRRGHLLIDASSSGKYNGHLNHTLFSPQIIEQRNRQDPLITGNLQQNQQFTAFRHKRLNKN